MSGQYVRGKHTKTTMSNAYGCSLSKCIKVLKNCMDIKTLSLESLRKLCCLPVAVNTAD